MLCPSQKAVPCSNVHRSSWWPGASHGHLFPHGKCHRDSIYHSKEIWEKSQNSYVSMLNLVCTIQMFLIHATDFFSINYCNVTAYSPEPAVAFLVVFTRPISRQGAA